MIRLLEQHRRDHPGETTLPWVLPVLVHHGSRSWVGPLRTRELFATTDPLAAVLLPRQIELECVLIELAEVSESDLLALPVSPYVQLTLLMLAVLRRYEDAEALEHLARWGGVLRALHALPGGAAALSKLLHYALLATAVDPEQLNTVVTKVLGKDATPMLHPNLQRMLDEASAKASAKTRAETKAQTRAETLAFALRRVLQRRFGDLPFDLDARIEAASAEQLEAWLERAATEPTLDDVFSEG